MSSGLAGRYSAIAVMQEKAYSSDLTATILPITEPYGYPMLMIHGAATDNRWQPGCRCAFGVLPLIN